MARKRAAQKRKQSRLSLAEAARVGGQALVSKAPLFAGLLMHVAIVENAAGNLCPAGGWAVVTRDGRLHLHPTRRGEPLEWAYVIAHGLLHLAFGHFQRHDNARAWNAACDCVVARFLADLKFGRAPVELAGAVEIGARTEAELYAQFCADGVPQHLQGFGTAGMNAPDMSFVEAAITGPSWERPGQVERAQFDWPAAFGRGLVSAVEEAVVLASGQTQTERGPAARARTWFVNHFPLLGALAAGFTLVENAQVCGRLGIHIAAVDVETREVYVNPAAGLDEAEYRFVVAHELLHAGLGHVQRCQGRDPFLWNVACDFVINQWLIELGVGYLPRVGMLFDAELKGLSAEAIYDRIVTDMRAYRKLCTLRGVGVTDLLAHGRDPWAHPIDMDLDEFCRNALSQGLALHLAQGRGFLPAGLVEEIRALYRPPIGWDVALAQWFDAYFPPVEKQRTYARPSRRQAATPDIPRPRYVTPDAIHAPARTYGVVLDTSGSMERQLLAKALGTIASYSIAREVPLVRVVFCDAETYDQGYMAPEDIAGRVRVKGRGGTILQPAINLLESARDFPDDGPLLIITDGFCDRLNVRRTHAYVLPEGRHLPFVPRGPVFRLR